RNRFDAQHFRTKRLDQLIFLRRLVVGHDDHAPITARVADVRKTDSGVAGGTLDNSAAWLQTAAPLGILDDRTSSAVLDRAARIHELRFAENLTTGEITEAIETDKRRIADRLGKTAPDRMAHAERLPSV